MKKAKNGVEKMPREACARVFLKQTEGHIDHTKMCSRNSLINNIYLQKNVLH